MSISTFASAEPGPGCLLRPDAAPDAADHVKTRSQVTRNFSGAAAQGLSGNREYQRKTRVPKPASFSLWFL